MASTSRNIALVTGGNNGIGYEIVKALFGSNKPYHVLLGSRSLEKANAAVENLKKECPESTNSVEIVQVDLTSDESISKAFEQVKASPGHIDTLINNAGMSLQRFCVNVHAHQTNHPSRCQLRHRTSPWQRLPPLKLHQILRRQRRWHARSDPHLHPPSPQVHRPAPHLHRRPLRHQPGW